MTTDAADTTDTGSAGTLQVARGCPFAPPEQHMRLLRERPVAKVTLPTGRDAWVASRYQDIRTVLSDPRFSANRRHPGAPRLVNGPDNEMAMSPLPKMMLEMDGAEHAQARRAVVGEFTVRRMAALRPRIQQFVDEHLDAMLAGPRPADLVTALALPVPSLVICELLGVPYADHDFFQVNSAQLLNRRATEQERQHAVLELAIYLDKLIAAKEQEPADDLLGRQIAKQRDNGGVDRPALLSLAFLLLIAGHETTANMISLGTYTLLERPEALEALRADPDRWGGAVEELLRYFTIAEFAMARVALEDVELGGAVIPAGSGVLMLANAGNRDPEVFEDGDRFDPARDDRSHLAFGYGPHQCLGQNLARVELEIVFETLFRRVPGLRLAVPADQLTFKDEAAVYGMHELPVTW
ncbi:cytochrome P450 [Actinomadura sp. ATCC 31491]|uniref:Cytochrome P450 n=1 Tax=Actinomadura luzonensis TaxID=2805427 RepID=A0ABT0FVD9_9ACTN|nr:cytochrome P450 [Actinomadura luzonensis]MCK2216291.1 cytochrome P450 [Actinomadura luzonensis]